MLNSALPVDAPAPRRGTIDAPRCERLANREASYAPAKVSATAAAMAGAKYGRSVVVTLFFPHDEEHDDEYGQYGE